MDIYLAITKTNSNNVFEANAKATHTFTFKLALNDNRVTNFVFTLVVWNTLISIYEQTSNDKERDSREESDTFSICFMAQGDDPLEVNSESDFDESENISYDDLAMFCQ